MRSDAAYLRLSTELGRVFGEMVAAQEDANGLRAEVEAQTAVIADLRTQLARSQDAIQEGGDPR